MSRRMVAPGVWIAEPPAEAHLTRPRYSALPVTTLPNVKPQPAPWSVQRQARLRFEERRREGVA